MATILMLYATLHGNSLTKQTRLKVQQHIVIDQMKSFHILPV